MRLASMILRRRVAALTISLLRDMGRAMWTTTETCHEQKNVRHITLPDCGRHVRHIKSEHLRNHSHPPSSYRHNFGYQFLFPFVALSSIWLITIWSPNRKNLKDSASSHIATGYFTWCSEYCSSLSSLQSLSLSPSAFKQRFTIVYVIIRSTVHFRTDFVFSRVE